jgi:K+-sensing histidine kinase KdpD
MASAAFGGFGPRIFAVVLSGVAVTYLLIEPIYTLRIAESSSAIQLALFCVVGVTIAWGVTLLTRARQQAEESRERFHRTFAHAHIGWSWLMRRAE